LIYILVTRRAEYDPSLLVGQEEKYQQRRKKRVPREANEMGYELIEKAA
jgi:hypothetical protein